MKPLAHSGTSGAVVVRLPPLAFVVTLFLISPPYLFYFVLQHAIWVRLETKPLTELSLWNTYRTVFSLLLNSVQTGALSRGYGMERIRCLLVYKWPQDQVHHYPFRFGYELGLSARRLLGFFHSVVRRGRDNVSATSHPTASFSVQLMRGATMVSQHPH